MLVDWRHLITKVCRRVHYGHRLNLERSVTRDVWVLGLHRSFELTLSYVKRYQHYCRLSLAQSHAMKSLLTNHRDKL